MKKRASKPLFYPRLWELCAGKFKDFNVGTEVMSGITVGLIALPLALALGIASIPQGAETPLPAPAIGTGLGLVAVGIIIFWPRLHLKRIPGSIVAMVLTTLVVQLFRLDHAPQVATIASKFGTDALAVGFPRPQLPRIDLSLIRDLIGPATAIALLGAIESLLSAVVADGLSGDRHDSNTELIAQGIANLTCPLFGGLPATGAIARTTANINAGGKTPLSGIIHAFTLLLLILVGAKWAGMIPMAAMSAVLMVVAIRMGDWHELRRCHKMPRSDALVLLTTFGLTVVFDLVIAVEVGMVLAAMLYIKRVSETTEVSQVTDQDMLERPEQMAQGKAIPPGVTVYRIFGPFMFGAAEKMEAALEATGDLPQVLILRLHLVTAMDATGLNALESLVERMQEHHKTVILSGVHLQPLTMMRKSGFVAQAGFENFTATFDEALLLADDRLKIKT